MHQVSSYDLGNASQSPALHTQSYMWTVMQMSLIASKYVTLLGPRARSQLNAETPIISTTVDVGIPRTYKEDQRGDFLIADFS